MDPNWDENTRKLSVLSTDSNFDEQLDIMPPEETKSKPNFGLLFDIDGVLARGLNPLPEAEVAFRLLCNDDGKLTVPVAFVTNGCSDAQHKADLISSWFNVEIHSDQIIQAPTPLTSFLQWHDKRVLFVGQEHVREIATELGFKKVVLMEEIQEDYPNLDMVDHSNRKKIADGYVIKRVPNIEAIILIGEPVRWESYLQLIVDLLITDGQPDHAPESYPDTHLPILACNLDLIFMAEAPMPRFGHGAFLVCLESLYEKITGNPLTYTAIIGKPSEITYRYAEHTLSKVAKRMGLDRPLQKIYFFGDNPEVDILGANLYNNYLRRYRRLSGRKNENEFEDSGDIDRKAAVATSRTVPAEADFLPQTVKTIESILVRTGVYKPSVKQSKNKKVNYCHRDFMGAADLVLPSVEVEDCLQGIHMIITQERYDPKRLKL